MCGRARLSRFDAKEHQRSLEVMRWGLIPFWAKDEKIGFSTINARAEEVDTKPAFREPFRQRRCLVPVENFYEWKKIDGGKQPYAIGLKGGGLMALAGLWKLGDPGPPANASAASRSSPPSRTNSAPNCTTVCPSFSRPKPGRHGLVRNPRTRRS